MDRFKLGAAVVLIAVLLVFLAFLVREKNIDTTLQASLVALATASIAGLVQLFRSTGGGEPPKGPPSNILALVLSLSTILASTASLGCANAPPKLPTPTTDQKEVFAGVTFKAQLMACVDKNDTSESMDKCATEVIARWGKDGGAK